jgi:hypothetical protein
MNLEALDTLEQVEAFLEGTQVDHLHGTPSGAVSKNWRTPQTNSQWATGLHPH